MSTGFALTDPGRWRVRPPATAETKERVLDPARELDRFLADVDQSAFRIARYQLGDADDALDVVQDSMIRLVRHYARRPPGEWKALFFRILQNRVRDLQRKRAVRARVTGWLPGPRRDEEAPPDPIQQAPDPSAVDPGRQLALDGAMAELQEAVMALPARQREAFLLRTMESMSVEETAAAMGCSQGSVKTHYSRAVHRLREQLGEHWDVSD